MGQRVRGRNAIASSNRVGAFVNTRAREFLEVGPPTPSPHDGNMAEVDPEARKIAGYFNSLVEPLGGLGYYHQR